jgi:hypothetical protein
METFFQESSVAKEAEEAAKEATEEENEEDQKDIDDDESGRNLFYAEENIFTHLFFFLKGKQQQNCISILIATALLAQIPENPKLGLHSNTRPSGRHSWLMQSNH